MPIAPVMTLISTIDSLLTRLDDLLHSERFLAQVRFTLHRALADNREAKIGTVVPVFLLAFTCLAYGVFVVSSSSFDEPAVKPTPASASPPEQAKDSSESDGLSTVSVTPPGVEDRKDNEGEKVKRIPRANTRQP